MKGHHVLREVQGTQGGSRVGFKQANHRSKAGGERLRALL